MISLKIKEKKVLLLFFIIWFALLAVFAFVLGYTHPYQGFVVDESENVYIGKDTEIAVYDNNNSYLYSIDTSGYRGYRFAIYENSVVIQSGNYYYFVDETGKETPFTEEEKSEIGIKLQFESYEYRANSTRYKMKRSKDIIQIVDTSDGRVVFEEKIEE